MRVIATDEAEGDTYTYESQEYEGVNAPAQIYQLARFHYADAKNRRRTISLRCLDEALLCTRGDLVDCSAPTISPHGLQVGRVKKIERDEDNQCTMVNKLDKDEYEKWLEDYSLSELWDKNILGGRPV